jgi:hypothetical protein
VGIAHHLLIEKVQDLSLLKASDRKNQVRLLANFDSHPVSLALI